jgi:hypothetical protein
MTKYYPQKFDSIGHVLMGHKKTLSASPFEVIQLYEPNFFEKDELKQIVLK